MYCNQVKHGYKNGYASRNETYQVANAIVGVVRCRECNAELCHRDEAGADGQRADQVQVVGITSWQHQRCHGKGWDGYRQTRNESRTNPGHGWFHCFLCPQLNIGSLASWITLKGFVFSFIWTVLQSNLSLDTFQKPRCDPQQAVVRTCLTLTLNRTRLIRGLLSLVLLHVNVQQKEQRTFWTINWVWNDLFQSTSLWGSKCFRCCEDRIKWKSICWTQMNPACGIQRSPLLFFILPQLRP